MTARITAVARVCAGTSRNPPPNAPTGVRSGSQMTASRTLGLLSLAPAQRGGGLVADLVRADARSGLDQFEPVHGDVDDGEIGNDAGDAAQPGDRQVALLDDLR